MTRIIGQKLQRLAKQIKSNQNMLWKTTFSPDKGSAKRKPEADRGLMDKAAGSMKFG